ncbi:MAG: type II secretion system protein [Wolinella sp.]
MSFVIGCKSHLRSDIMNLNIAGAQSNARPAFTMIELVFIIVILGILASIAVPKMAASREDAQIALINQDIATVIQALPAMGLSQGSDVIKSFGQAVTLNSSVWEVIPSNNESYPNSADGSLGGAASVRTKLKTSDIHKQHCFELRIYKEDLSVPRPPLLRLVAHQPNVAPCNKINYKKNVSIEFVGNSVKF